MTRPSSTSRRPSIPASRSRLRALAPYGAAAGGAQPFTLIVGRLVRRRVVQAIFQFLAQGHDVRDLPAEPGQRSQLALVGALELGRDLAMARLVADRDDQRRAGLLAFRLAHGRPSRGAMTASASASLARECRK
jgi:hypothetical protein